MIALETSAKGIRGLKKYKECESENVNSELSELKNGANDIENYESDGNNEDTKSEDSAMENEKSNGNSGWADAMQKVLKTNKPKKKKTIVLSKAKKITEIRSEENLETLQFEIETENGEIKREILLTKKEADKEDTAPSKRRKKNLQLGIRVKPSIHDRMRERVLQKIATKGVVQLFNVVKQQQTEIAKKIVEVGPLERKREQVLKNIDKRTFLDVLMGGSKSIPVENSSNGANIENNEDSKTDKVWSVLRDEFAMGAKLKDWDKKAPEDDNDATSSEEMDSD